MESKRIFFRVSQSYANKKKLISEWSFRLVLVGSFLSHSLSKFGGDETISEDMEFRSIAKTPVVATQTFSMFTSTWESVGDFTPIYPIYK